MSDGSNLTGVDGNLDIGPLEDLPSYVPLREAVFLTLKRAILDGSLKPGQTISENRIAGKLSVSRTPVREAIRILETASLVTSLPGRKVVVSAPSPRDIEEVYEIRSIVEIEAVRRITPDREDLVGALERHIGEAERLRKEGNLLEMAEANNCFHQEIISALGNQRLERFIGSLNDTISQFRSYSLTPEWALESEKQHKEMIAHLKNGDTEKATSILRHNLLRPKQMLSAQFADAKVTPKAE